MTEITGESDAAAVPEATQRPGVPTWRVGKPDSFLAADVAAAFMEIRLGLPSKQLIHLDDSSDKRRPIREYNGAS